MLVNLQHVPKKNATLTWTAHLDENAPITFVTQVSTQRVTGNVGKMQSAKPHQQHPTQFVYVLRDQRGILRFFVHFHHSLHRHQLDPLHGAMLAIQIHVKVPPNATLSKEVEHAFALLDLLGIPQIVFQQQAFHCPRAALVGLPGVLVDMMENADREITVSKVAVKICAKAFAASMPFANQLIKENIVVFLQQRNSYSLRKVVVAALQDLKEIRM